MPLTYHFPRKTPRKALVAAEDPQARKYLREALSRAGYASEICSDPRMILEPDRTEGHDFLILNDDVAGREVMSRLRQTGAAIPAILISGRSEPSEESWGPAMHHLATPFTLKTLKAAIGRVCPTRT
jgi:DNA-binding response OmpR family regulator